MIFFSLISGIGSLNATASMRLGCCTLVYYVSTTCLAVGEGFAWIYAVKPGADVRLAKVKGGGTGQVNNLDMFLDLLR